MKQLIGNKYVWLLGVSIIGWVFIAYFIWTGKSIPVTEKCFVSEGIVDTIVKEPYCYKVVLSDRETLFVYNVVSCRKTPFGLMFYNSDERVEAHIRKNYSYYIRIKKDNL